MLNRLPKTIPPLSWLLDDIGSPSSDQVGKALQVSARQVNIWRKADEAPRSVMLSLFWLTRWGVSAVDCQAFNDAQLAHGLARAHATEASNLRVELARIISIADFGCANQVHQARYSPKSASAGDRVASARRM